MSSKDLPFSWQFGAGAIAGISEICITYPLDVIKTRFQLQNGSLKAAKYTSIYDCVRTILKNEGPGSFYRGLLAPILVEAPKRAIKFSANEKYSSLLCESFNFRQNTQSLSIITGVLAGVTEGALIVPFEVVKVQLQDSTKVKEFSSTFDCIAKTFNSQGISRFFKGLEATLLRHAAWNGGYFGTIFYIRSSPVIKQLTDRKIVSDFIAGSMGGIFGTILNTPFDVCKTRIQASDLKSPYTLHLLRQIYGTEG